MLLLLLPWLLLLLVLMEQEDMLLLLLLRHVAQVGPRRPLQGAAALRWAHPLLNLWLLQPVQLQLGPHPVVPVESPRRGVPPLLLCELEGAGADGHAQRHNLPPPQAAPLPVVEQHHAPDEDHQAHRVDPGEALVQEEHRRANCGGRGRGSVCGEGGQGQVCAGQGQGQV